MFMIKCILTVVLVVLALAVLTTATAPAVAQSPRRIELIADLGDVRVYTIEKNGMSVPCFLAVTKSTSNANSAHVALACP